MISFPPANPPANRPANGRPLSANTAARAQAAASSSELLPWQAVLMILCLTIAGLVHEHAGLLRPFLAKAHAATLGVRAELTAPAALSRILAPRR